MTPLAARFAKELTLPLKRRSIRDDATLLKHIGETHCFEVSEVIDLARNIAVGLMSNEAPIDAFGGLAFLPAPFTWIEWKEASGKRIGFRLWCEPGRTIALVDVAVEGGSTPMFALPLDGNQDRGRAILQHKECVFTEDHINGTVWLLYALLTMINAPRRINQRVHMPNSRLQRRLAASKKLVGKFPLHAWREITLKVGSPIDASDAEAWQDHLSNQMPLHFVRAHKRRVPDRLGPWTLIPACWRGNPALGIKQTRHKLAA